MNIKYSLAVTVMASFIFGCGGGKSDDNGNGGGSIPQDIAGDWVTSCLSFTNGSSAIFYASHEIIDGTAFYGEGVEAFDTSDCSGTASAEWKLGGKVTYGGTVSTSTCKAEKFDAQYSVLVIKEKTYTGAEFDSAMNQLSNLSKSKSSMACIYNDDYLEAGQGNEMNTEVVYYRDN